MNRCGRAKASSNSLRSITISRPRMRTHRAIARRCSKIAALVRGDAVSTKRPWQRLPQGSKEVWKTRHQLLVLNKFGKVECSGGGLRDLVASAIDRGIPVIIGVPRRNLEVWRNFAGEFATELSDDAGQILEWLEGLR